MTIRYELSLNQVRLLIKDKVEELKEFITFPEILGSLSEIEQILSDIKNYKK